MITYNDVLWISCIIVPYSWLFATLHKIWRECILGYILITVFASVLFLRMIDILDASLWSSVYLVLTCFVCISVVIYSIYIKYRRRCKNDLKGNK